MKRNLVSLVGIGGILIFMTGAVPDRAARPQGDMSWRRAQIGNADVEAEAAWEDNVLRVSATGADIWAAADSFHFVHQQWRGDGEIVARVVEVEDTHEWAKAGVMFRNDLTEGSAHAFVALSPRKGVNFIRREVPRGASEDDSHHFMRVVEIDGVPTFQLRGDDAYRDARDALTDTKAPRWVKLVRAGDAFVAYDSADGEVWNWLGTALIPMEEEIFVGLAVSSHDVSRSCRAVFDQVSVGAVALESGTAPVTGEGEGLSATYYSRRDLSGDAQVRRDGEINFDWGGSSPAEGIPADGFSVRWEGAIQAQYSEPYLLHFRSDDRAMVWFDGQLLIDEWREFALHESTAWVRLEAGRKYLLRIEYFENRGNAVAQLHWSSPSTPKQVVPRSQLYSALPDEDSDGLPDLWEEKFGLRPDDPTDANRDENGDGTSNLVKFREGRSPKARFAQSREVGNGWQARHVGGFTARGSAEIRGPKSMRIAGSGPRAGGIRDEFQWAYRPWEGDVEIKARIGGQEDSDIEAMAGITIRESLQPDERQVALGVTAEGRTRLMSRRFPKEWPREDEGGSGMEWLKLVRRGELVQAFESADGTSWHWVGTEQIELPERVFVGLAVNSFDPNQLNTAEFSEIEIRKPESLPASVIARAVVGQGDGLTGTYFDSQSGLPFTRIDPNIDFDWDIGIPYPEIGSDQFSIRWEGILEAQFSEPYVLEVVSDDGARLWLDEQLIIDDWKDGMPLPSRARANLEAGRRYDLRLEYYERTGEAIIQLRWCSPSTPKQAIPTSQLYSSGSVLDSRVVRPIRSAGNLGQSESSARSGVGRSVEPTATPLRSASDSAEPPHLTGFAEAATVPGARFEASLGQWQTNGKSVYSIDHRGYLEYEITAPEAGMYRLVVHGSETSGHWDRDLPLRVTLDGESLGRLLLDAGGDRPAAMITPWIRSGPHGLRLFWDNARPGKTLAIEEIRLEFLLGPDTDEDGTVDWVTEELKRVNAVEVGPVSSRTSPVALEGRGLYRSMMSVVAGDASVPVLPAPNDRWYANVDLAAEEPAEIAISYENGGLNESIAVEWVETPLDAAGELTLRKGDALRLVVRSRGGNFQPVTIDVAGAAQYETVTGVPVIHRFEDAGSFQVRGRGEQLTVHVVEAELGDPAAAWVGKERNWSAEALPKSVVLEADSRLNWKERSTRRNGGTLGGYTFVIDESDARYVVARLGENGPILDHLEIQGFELFSGSMTGGLRPVETFADGSRFAEMSLVLSPVLPRVNVEVSIAVGGITFDDGTVIRNLAPADFDSLGMAQVDFFVPAIAETSACHRTEAFQNNVFLGIYE